MNTPVWFYAVKIEIDNFNSLILSFFFIPLTASKVLSLDYKKKNFGSSFVLCSLIRTFARGYKD
jgi:hypothetical protein